MGGLDLSEIRFESVDWIHMTQGRGPVAGFCEHANEPFVSIKDGEFFG
jgi:hypothetical protein